MATSSFICCCFTLAVVDFTSVGTIFLNLLELYSTLHRKKVFVTNFPLLMDSLLTVTKVFLLMLPYVE